VASSSAAKEARPQPTDKAVEKRVKEVPSKATEKPEIKKKKGKSSSSSSSEPGQKQMASSNKSTRVEKVESVGVYRKWIREFSRQGFDISQIKRLDLEDDKKLKLYCVWVGRSRGIFKDWETCLPLVDKHQGAKYRRVDGTLVEVLKAFKERLEQL